MNWNGGTKTPFAQMCSEKIGPTRSYSELREGLGSQGISEPWRKSEKTGDNQSYSGRKLRKSCKRTLEKLGPNC